MKKLVLFFIILGIILALFKISLPHLKKKTNRRLTNPIEITKENLIGIWHECDHMPSGWCTHYNFYPSGKYRLFYNSMACDKTKTEESGLWDLNGSTLTLTIKEEIILKGGEMVEAGGSCSKGQMLIGATPAKNILTKPRVEIYELKPITRSLTTGGVFREFEELNYSGIYMNLDPFWKFYEDPTGGTWEDFPEPTGF